MKDSGQTEQASRENRNRLADETSPYLLQHANNPVDWFPWGKEAFDKAQAENKPIFLSIGYSTCHWCHVMEHESFENVEIAEVLNQYYVPVKVDREERPDVDGVYMNAVQTLTGSGGWPMSVWLTPDLKPYYAGTYFPARDGDRGCRIGFLTILKKLNEAYRENPGAVMEQAHRIAEELKNRLQFSAGTNLPDATSFREAFTTYRSQYDSVYGGFGGPPKFPRPSSFEFLFRFGRRSNEKEATEMSLHTLKKMAHGGIYDQLRGGFHRYSTDREWFAPHFEKMLYDNAQLVLSFLDAFQISADPEYERVARETLDYVAQEMTDEQGGFHSATDADSEGIEGKFFVWSYAEFVDVLGAETGAIVAEHFGVTADGNFEGQNILHIAVPIEELARKLNKDAVTVRQIINNAKEKLLHRRAQRVPPHKDDKIVTAWNGLMIAAFSRAAWMFQDQKYKKRAEEAAQFILEHVRRDGLLFRSYRKSLSLIPGYLDDYAFLIYGLLELFEASSDIKWLHTAIELQETLLREFWDKDQQGFFMASARHQRLMTREKPFYDGAEPSGNSMATFNLLRLEAFTGKIEYGEKGREVLRAFSSVIGTQPTVMPFMLAALDFYLDRVKEVAIVAPGGEGKKAEAFMEVFRHVYIPNRVFLFVEDATKYREIADVVPWLSGRETVDKSPVAYVCEKGVCNLPSIDPEQFQTEITKIHPVAN